MFDFFRSRSGKARRKTSEPEWLTRIITLYATNKELMKPPRAFTLGGKPDNAEKLTAKIPSIELVARNVEARLQSSNPVERQGALDELKNYKMLLVDKFSLPLLQLLVANSRRPGFDWALLAGEAQNPRRVALGVAFGVYIAFSEVELKDLCAEARRCLARGEQTEAFRHVGKARAMLTNQELEPKGVWFEDTPTPLGLEYWMDKLDLLGLDEVQSIKDARSRWTGLLNQCSLDVHGRKDVA